ncbi:oligosaccharide flippase family protein [Tomitella fengzijianii]|uniref:Oligosaccharide flippase family protein n=1 Tax=Tomitella fengzijianii TaxID=2597660 RepID=A0A516X0X9_9ACTN|nr:oligosaccharide flippase family protein [Tomitella fengzijianii]QDQ96667.1 oligosaccharide flippase family protein [Tomitella fengzijianii]
MKPQAPPTATSPTLTRRIGRVACAAAAAQAVGELVSLAQTVALARLLSPSVVGLFVAGTVLSAFLSNFVEGGLRSGLVHREDRLDDAADTVFYATLGSGVLMTVGALALSPLIGIVFHSATAGYVAAASSGTLLLFSLTNVPEALLQRRFSVTRRIVVGPAVAVSFAATAVTLAALGAGVWSMVAGSYVSYVVWVIAVWTICRWRPGRGHPSVRLWREHARYGYPLVLGMVGARVQTLAQSVFVGRGLSDAALGWFRYASRISQAPVTALIEVGSVSLFPAFSRIAHDHTRFRAGYLRALTLSVFGGAAMSGLLIAAGEPAVVVAFGEPWRGAGTALVAMAGMGLGKAFTCVSEEAIKGGGRTGLLNWYTLVETVLSIALLVALIRPLGVVGAGLSVSITAVVVGMVCVVLARPVVGFVFREVVTASAAPIAAAVVATVAVGTLEHMVFRSDTHALPVALSLLALDLVAFCTIDLIVFAALAPSTARRIVVRFLDRARRSGGLETTEEAGLTTGASD